MLTSASSSGLPHRESFGKRSEPRCLWIVGLVSVSGPRLAARVCSQQIITSYLICDLGKSAREYVEAIAHREMAWISRYAKPNSKISGYPRGKGSQKSPQAHIKLLEKYLAVAARLLPDDAELVRPELWHPDIHDANIFVQDGRITSIIDWQSVWAGPLLLQARTPRLIDYNGEIQLRIPDNYKTLSKEEKEEVSEQVKQSIQVYLYEDQTAKVNPLLNRAVRQPHGKTLGELVCFAGNSWDDHIVPIRDTLINIERYLSRLAIGSRV